MNQYFYVVKQYRDCSSSDYGYSTQNTKPYLACALAAALNQKIIDPQKEKINFDIVYSLQTKEGLEYVVIEELINT